MPVLGTEMRWTGERPLGGNRGAGKDPPWPSLSNEEGYMYGIARPWFYRRTGWWMASIDGTKEKLAKGKTEQAATVDAALPDSNVGTRTLRSTGRSGGRYQKGERPNVRRLSLRASSPVGPISRRPVRRAGCILPPSARALSATLVSSRSCRPSRPRGARPSPRPAGCRCKGRA